MIYEYVCPRCGTIEEQPFFAKIGEPCINDGDEILYCECTDDLEDDSPMLRRVSMPQTQGAGVHNPYPYFNHNVGRVIESDKHFQQVLNEKAAKNEQLTGTSHSYRPVYPGDLKDDDTMKKLGVGQGADRGESIELSRRLNWRSKPATNTTLIDLGAK